MFRTLGIAMLIAILLVYIIMVATFHSLLNPLILLVSIPFAAVGAVLALVITGTQPRHAEPGRPPDAHRHRGDQRHRAARPGRAVPAQGHGRPHRRDRGRAAPPAADPHDRNRHDPRARAHGARHRRRGRRVPLHAARRGRHRRPVHVHVPDAHPGAGAVPRVRPAAAQGRVRAGRRGLHRPAGAAQPAPARADRRARDLDGGGSATTRPPSASRRRAVALRYP